MAPFFCDSFDYYSTAQIARKWAVVDGTITIGSANGRNGTNAMQINGNFGIVQQSFPSNLATVVVGGAFKWVSLSSGVAPFLYIRDGSTHQVYARLNADGSLSVFNGSGAALHTTAAGVVPLPTAQFTYIEMRVLISNTVGTVEVWINGASTPVINLTNVDTQNTANAYATNMWLSAAGANGNHIIVDDFYLDDSTNRGDVRIECKLPDGAGTTANLTPSAGANYENVDETPADDETTYNSSSNPGDKDTFAYAALSSTTGAIVAVAVNTMDRKDDAGARTHNHIARLSGTEVDGSAYSPTTSYVNHQTLFATKPGGGAWTISDVDNAEFGYKLAS